MTVSADALFTASVLLLSAALNAAVTWGVITERMRGLRRDVDLAQRAADRANERLDEHLEANSGG